MVEAETEITKDLFAYYYGNKFGSKNNQSNIFVDHLFKAFDRDDNQKLNFLEFLVGLTLFKSDDHYQNLKVFFRLFDVNKDKFIRKNEIELVLKTLNKASDMKQNFYVEMVKDFDLNKDESIDEDEFINGIVQNINYQNIIKIIQN